MAVWSSEIVTDDRALRPVDAAQIFAAVARHHASRPALVWSRSAATSYGQLDAISNRLARLLLARGVGKRDPVAICRDKDLLAYAAAIASLKIGAPYFFLDPANPAPRTRAMLNRCMPRAAVVDPAVDPVGIVASGAAVVQGDAGRLQADLASYSGEPIELPWTITGSDPAYIMFTSGSTGTPKGVTISHANVINFIGWTGEQFATTPDDVFTNVNPLFFDNSVFDIYASLFNGAALAPFPAAVMRDAKAIVSRIDDLGCTIYFSVPSLLVYLQTMKLIARPAFPSLRTIVFGGEGYPKPMLARLFDAVGDRIALYNVYGPTECTCICSAYRVTGADFGGDNGLAPLGTMTRNFSWAIVDEQNQETRSGEVGELILGGPCVGLGYYNDPAQTAAAFVQNPLHEKFFDRVYKTGDLVRYEPSDGKIRFVGRADSQIKHQGYRIELGEIEHALVSIDGVDEAAAVYVTGGAAPRIVGVVASTGDLAPAGVKKAVAEQLPKFMVPDRIVVVGRLLKSPNGKIDRAAIAASLAAAEV
jgi:amino acid adenylation domain-containing protein